MKTYEIVYDYSPYTGYPSVKISPVWLFFLKTLLRLSGHNLMKITENQGHTYLIVYEDL